MNNESFTPEELQKAEQLDTTIDTLRQSNTGQVGAASPSDIDPVFMERLHSNLLQRFAQKKSSSWKLWKMFGIPTATLAVLTIGVIAATKPEMFQQQKAATQIASGSAQSTNTLQTVTADSENHENTNTAKDEGGAAVDGNTPAADADTLPTVVGELASVEPDLSDLNTLNDSMQTSMDDLDEILDSIDSLASLYTDTDAVEQDIDQIAL